MQGYVCGKTKTTYEAVAPILKQELVSHGSSDTGLKKMNPIGVHFMISILERWLVDYWTWGAPLECKLPLLLQSYCLKMS